MHKGGGKSGGAAAAGIPGIGDKITPGTNKTQDANIQANPQVFQAIRDPLWWFLELQSYSVWKLCLLELLEHLFIYCTNPIVTRFKAYCFQLVLRDVGSIPEMCIIRPVSETIANPASLGIR